MRSRSYKEEQRLFLEFAADVRQCTNFTLQRYIDKFCERSVAIGFGAEHVATALRSILVRGGKRYRSVLLALAYEACDGHVGFECILPACASLELFQTYLLIHDDWMDQDDTRRGGPSAHILLLDHGDKNRADSGAILAGDLGSSLSLAWLMETEVSIEKKWKAIQVYNQFHEQVIFGQCLDVFHQNKKCDVGTHDPLSLSKIHELKTTSYTISGPLRMGLALAGDPANLDERFFDLAKPLGLAFQMRDDQLSLFGDEHKTGKKRGSDLIHGKKTRFLELAEDDSDLGPKLSRIFGKKDVACEEVDEWLLRAKESPLVQVVENEIEDLLERTHQCILHLPISELAKQRLHGAAESFCLRSG